MAVFIVTDILSFLNSVPKFPEIFPMTQTHPKAPCLDDLCTYENRDSADGSKIIKEFWRLNSVHASTPHRPESLARCCVGVVVLKRTNTFIQSLMNIEYICPFFIT